MNVAPVDQQFSKIMGDGAHPQKHKPDEVTRRNQNQKHFSRLRRLRCAWQNAFRHVKLHQAALSHSTKHRKDDETLSVHDVPV